MGMSKPLYGKISMRKLASQHISTRHPPGHEQHGFGGTDSRGRHVSPVHFSAQAPVKHVRFQSGSDVMNEVYANQEDLRALHEAQIELMRTHDELLRLEDEIRVARFK